MMELSQHTADWGWRFPEDEDPVDSARGIAQVLYCTTKCNRFIASHSAFLIRPSVRPEQGVASDQYEQTARLEHTCNLVKSSGFIKERLNYPDANDTVEQCGSVG